MPPLKALIGLSARPLPDFGQADGFLQIVCGLKIQPGLCVSTEIADQPQRGIRGHRPLLIQNFADPRDRNSQLDGQAVSVPAFSLGAA